ncbi:unnamed protein product [Cochlearia groenlandica]
MGSSFSMFNNKRRLITTRSQLDQEINLFLNRNQTHHQDHLSTNTIIDHQQQHQDQLISSFLEIAIGQTDETARRFLQATNWNIEESVNLFFIKNNNNNNYDHWHDIRVDEQPRSSDRELDPSLSSLYRPPIDLVFEGSFEEAKSVSSRENLWLLVNLQSRTEFASLKLNRDLWSNDAVLESVRSRFVLWQVYDHTTQGKKISNFYRIDSGPPAVLVIDPITGQKMRMWSGAIDAQSFLEDLVRFMEEGPNEHIYSLIRKRYPEAKVTCLSSYNTFQAPPPSWGEEFEEEDACSSSNNIEQIMVPSWGEEFEEEDAFSSSNNIEQTMVPSWGEEFEEEDACSSKETWLEYPDLTEEPNEDCDRNIVCGICVRFPDGRRKQRRFLKTEPVQLLWSFCYSNMDDSDKKKLFKLVHAIPGACKTLDYGDNLTFDQSRLANSMISVAWE